MTFDPTQFKNAIKNAGITRDQLEALKKVAALKVLEQKNTAQNAPAELTPVAVEAETAEAKEIAEIFEAFNADQFAFLGMDAASPIPKTWDEFADIVVESKKARDKKYNDQLADLRQQLLDIDKAEEEYLRNLAKEEQEQKEAARQQALKAVVDKTFVTVDKAEAEKIASDPELNAKGEYEVQEIKKADGGVEYTVVKKMTPREKLVASLPKAIEAEQSAGDYDQLIQIAETLLKDPKSLAEIAKTTKWQTLQKQYPTFCIGILNIVDEKNNELISLLTTSGSKADKQQKKVEFDAYYEGVLNNLIAVGVKKPDALREAFLTQIENGAFTTMDEEVAKDMATWPELAGYELKVAPGFGKTTEYSFIKKPEQKETGLDKIDSEQITGPEINAMLQKISDEPVKIHITLDADAKVEQTTDEVIKEIKSALDKTGLPYSTVEANEKGSAYLVVTKDGSKFEILKLLAVGNAPMPTYLNKAQWINHIIKTEPDAVRAWALNANKSETESTELKEELVSEHVLLMRKLLNTELEDLDLSVAAYNFLKASNIHSLGQLVQYTPEELAKLPNYTQKAFRIIEKLIADKGLAFGMDLDKYGEFEFSKKEKVKKEIVGVDFNAPVDDIDALKESNKNRREYEIKNVGKLEESRGSFGLTIRNFEGRYIPVNAQTKEDLIKKINKYYDVELTEQLKYSAQMQGKNDEEKKPIIAAYYEALDALMKNTDKERIDVTTKQEVQSDKIEAEKNPGDYNEVARLVRYQIENPKEPSTVQIEAFLKKYPNLTVKVEEIEKNRKEELDSIYFDNSGGVSSWYSDREDFGTAEKEGITEIVNLKYNSELEKLGIKTEEPNKEETKPETVEENSTMLQSIDTIINSNEQHENNKIIKIVNVIADFIDKLPNDDKLKLAEFSGDRTNAIRKNKIAAEYAKAKIENTNLELVKAVEDLIQGKELSIKDDTEITPDGSGKGDTASKKTEPVTPVKTETLPKTAEQIFKGKTPEQKKELLKAFEEVARSITRTNIWPKNMKKEFPRITADKMEDIILLLLDKQIAKKSRTNNYSVIPKTKEEITALMKLMQ